MKKQKIIVSAKIFTDRMVAEFEKESLKTDYKTECAYRIIDGKKELTIREYIICRIIGCYLSMKQSKQSGYILELK